MNMTMGYTISGPIVTEKEVTLDINIVVASISSVLIEPSKIGTG